MKNLLTIFFHYYFHSIAPYHTTRPAKKKIPPPPQKNKQTNSTRIDRIESYDRRDKPSVLVTSPSSPDRIGGSDGAAGIDAGYANRLTPTGSLGGESCHVGGRIQIKLGFEPSALQVILTVIGATGLTLRSNGTVRTPYVKVNNTKMMVYPICLLALKFVFSLFLSILRIYQSNSHDYLRCTDDL